MIAALSFGLPDPERQPVVSTLGVRLADERGDEGRFARIEAGADAIRVSTDPLGMLPIFVGIDPSGRRVVTDSILEASQGSFPTRFDPIGVAGFVSLGWPPAERTIFDGWRVLPPGESLVRVDSVESGPDPLATLESSPRRGDVESASRAAVARLTDWIRARFETRPETIVQLTGGQDSRVVLALALRTGRRPECVTRGARGDPEVEFAKVVARLAGCRHHVVEEDGAQVVGDREVLVRRLLRRTDGMVSHWQLADVADRPEVSSSWLGGVGGEIARRYWDQKTTRRKGATRADVVDALHGRLTKNPGALLRADVFAEFSDFLRVRLGELAESLRDPSDLPDVFYAKERVRKWGGANARKVPPGVETLPILASRTFYECALSIPIEARVSGALHREIVARAAPALLGAPLLHAEWEVPALRRWLRGRRSRRLPDPSGPTTITRTREELRRVFVESMRTRILDEPRSPLFDLFDRTAIESALASSEHHPDPVTQALFAFLTLHSIVAGVGDRAERS